MNSLNMYFDMKSIILLLAIIMFGLSVLLLGILFGTGVVDTSQEVKNIYTFCMFKETM